ncbi:MAG: class I SAM-dependent methyltransferase [Syntrophales bacterium]|jgi:ubiquinone/menaquinone biosynthesis C-methylase UbiE|nr:class I SAM-dependent methyltransferase [Syntrophales bacterium]MDY0045403.1 class I SAM-dependent methyltransferase [Syntrophales bacterium]
MNGREKPDYGNWVPKRIIIIPLAAGIFFIGLSFWSAVMAIPAIIFLLISLYLYYVRFALAGSDNNVQESIWKMVTDTLDWSGKGKILDIGCGNGAVTVTLAKKLKSAEIYGIDYWGKRWEYSLETCKRNADIEGVGDRVIFQKARAESLPFDNEYFDAVVSNFVFHEVSSVRDKRELIYEALRVLKKGGTFVFQDEFLIKKLYGEPDELIASIKTKGIKRAEFIHTRNAPFIPRLLKIPFILGSMGMIKGEK